MTLQFAHFSKLVPPRLMLPNPLLQFLFSITWNKSPLATLRFDVRLQ